MKGYILGKIILGVAGISASLLLVLSLAPIAFGGLDVSMNEDLTFEYDDVNKTLQVETSINVTSSMPWDIGLSYEIILGTGDNPAFTSPGSTTLKRGETGVLEFEAKAEASALLVYLLSSMEMDFRSVDEHGAFSGRFMLPLTVNISGDYVRNLVDFDISVVFDLGGEATGTLGRNDPGTILEGTVTFADPSILPITAFINLPFSIEPNGGSLATINGVIGYYNPGSPNLSLTINTSGPSIESILKEVEEYGGIVKIDATPVTMTPELMSMLIRSISGMLDHAAVTL